MYLTKYKFIVVYIIVVLPLTLPSITHANLNEDLNNAVRSENISEVKKLLATGANPQSINKLSEAPSLEISNLLLNNKNHPLDPTKFLNLILSTYGRNQKMREQKISLIELALQKGAKVKSLEPLRTLLTPKSVELLLAKHYNPTEILQLILTDEPLLSKQKELMSLAIENYRADTGWIHDFTDIYTLLTKNQTYINRSQISIMGKLGSSLKKLSSNDLNKLGHEFIIGPGHCYGLVTFWLYSKWLQSAFPETNSRYDHFWFKNTITDILRTNDDDAISYEDSLAFQRFSSIIDFFHRPDIYMQGVTQLSTEKLLKTGILDTYGKSLIRKYAITSVVNSPGDVYYLLKNIVHDDEWIYILTPRHTAGLFKHGKNYHYYEPIDPRGQIKSTSLEKIASNIYSINKQITDRYTHGLGIISISVIGEADKIISYPDPKKLLTKTSSHLNQAYLQVIAEESITANSLESVKFFLDQGADLKGQNYLISFASEKNFHEIVAELLKRGADPTSYYYYYFLNGTPLHASAMDGSTEALLVLLEDPRTDINQKNLMDEKTALIYATERHYIDIVKILVAKGADKNLTDENGETALDIAIRKWPLDKEMQNLLSN